MQEPVAKESADLLLGRRGALLYSDSRDQGRYSADCEAAQKQTQKCESRYVRWHLVEVPVAVNILA